MAIDVKDVQEAFQDTKSGWDENYKTAKADLKFQHGGSQWDDGDRNAREVLKRPCLEVNLLPQFVRQITNDVRMNTPAINVSPVGGGADMATAKVLQGLIRNIEYTSSAAEAYSNALEYAVKGGIGFFRLDHDYEALDGFNQQIFIRKVVNPFANFIDPKSIEDDGCDAKLGFTIDGLTKKEFEELYPDADAESFDKDDQKSGSGALVTVAEYFHIEEEEKQAALLEDGTVVEYAKGMDGVKAVRKLKKKKVYRCRVSGADILEETIFPGIYIPIIPVYGEVTWIDGKRKIKSLIADMKDPQKMHNYWASLETQILMMQPIAPVMAEFGQTEDFADDWNNPGNASVLRYKGTNALGEKIAPPQRLNPPVTPQGITNARMTSAENMKQTVGMYDDSLGQRSNAVSGVAINNRKVEGEVATYHFGDNLNRSIAHGGRVALSMIPTIYDTSRVVRIMGEEDSSEEIGINGEFVAGQKQAFDLTAGQYDVRVTAGPSFTTKRQEAAQYLQTLIQAQPELVQIAGDILVKNMDFPGSEALADRLRKMVPPNLLSEKDRQANQEEDPEKIELAKKLQEASQHMATLQSALDDKTAKEQADIETDRMRVAIEAEKAKTDKYKVESDVELRAAELHLQATAPKASAGGTAKAAAPSSGSAPPQSGAEEEMLSIDELRNLLEQRTQKKMEDDAAAAEMQRQMAEQQAAIAEQEAAKEHGEKQFQVELVSAVVGAVKELTAAVQTPKQVIRDDAGKVVGVK